MLPPITNPRTSNLSIPACVLRLNFPVPLDNLDVERTGHFTFVLQTQCVDRAVAPCSLLTEQPTAANPVTVQWSPGPFYVAACGRDDYPWETDQAAAQGKCLHGPPSASASPSSS